MSRKAKDLNSSGQRLQLRKLQFDSLEDRRLLAGLNVFVFDDANASGTQDVGEAPKVGQVVFLDKNQNASWDHDEAWLATDATGSARFEDLALGTYHPTLLGFNPSQTQTSPVDVAFSGQIINITNAASATNRAVVGWKNDEVLLVQEGNALRQVSILGEPIATAINFPGSIVSVQTNQETMKGLAIIRRATNELELFAIDFQRMTAKSIPSSRGMAWTQIGYNESHYFAVSNSMDASNQVVSTMVRVDLVQRSLQPIAGLNLPANATVTGFANSNRFATLTQGPNAQATLYSLESTAATTTATQLWTKSLSDASLLSIVRWDTLGEKLIGKRNDGSTSVIDVTQEWNAVLPLSSAFSAFYFDHLRGQLFAYDPSSNQIVQLDDTTWEEIGRFQTFESVGVDTNEPIEGEPKPVGLTHIDFSPHRERMIGGLNGKVYVHEIAKPSSPLTPLELNSEVAEVEFGIRSIGTNRQPIVNAPAEIALIEDSTQQWSSSQWSSFASDPDQDATYFLVTQPPSHGRLNWTEQQGYIYQPNDHFEGEDVFVVQAYDGRDWSAPASITIQVNGVNDAPQDFAIDIATVPEHVQPGESLGVLAVMDPDRDASYHITVSDSRFLVVDGLLKLADGQRLNFEAEATIPLEFIATDTTHPDDRISRTVTLSLRDQNDAPTGIHIELINVGENEPGSVIGTILVDDEDAQNQFLWQFSDPRFEVVDGNLKLKEDQSLDFETDKTLKLDLTLTDDNGLGTPLQRSVSVNLSDRNDPIQDIVLSNSVLFERIKGAVVGTVSVIDQDPTEAFDLTVSDERFVVANGVLKLKPDQYVLVADAVAIIIDITATSKGNGESKTKRTTLAVRGSTVPWRNPENPMDVNGDGVLSPLDPLRVINHLNKFGIQRLENPAEGEPAGDFLDVNGDGYVSPLDVLIVINALNLQGAGGSGGGQGSGQGQGSQGEGEGELLIVTSEVAPSTESPSSHREETTPDEAIVRQSPGMLDLSLADYLNERDSLQRNKKLGSRRWL